MKEENCETCRVCLENSINTINVKKKIRLNDTLLSIHDVFHEISGLYIEDFEPQGFCGKCFEDLKISYEFKVRYDLAQIELKKCNDIPKIEDDPEPFVDCLDIFNSEIKDEPDSPEGNDYQFEPEVIVTAKKESRKQRNKDQYICLYCSKSFSYLGRFEAHLRAKHQKKPEVKCTLCGKLQFTDCLSLHEVLCKPNIPKSTDDATSNCPYCTAGVNLNTPLRLFLHLKRFHKDKATVQCEHCDLMVCPEVAEYHNVKCSRSRSKTNKEERVVCQYCGKSVRRSNYTTHQRSHEGHQEPMYCDLCGYKGNHRHNMVNHMRNRHLKIPHKCKHCDKCDFKNYSAVVSHLRKAHADIFPLFKCTQCPYEASEKSTLNTHMKRHAGEVARVHRCEICGKGFAVMSKLKIHLQRHGDERNFSCEICGAAYKTKNSLYTHRQTHSAAKDYECPVCQRSYATNQQMKVHAKKNHPWFELPPPGTIMKKTLSKPWMNKNFQPFSTLLAPEEDAVKQ